MARPRIHADKRAARKAWYTRHRERLSAESKTAYWADSKKRALAKERAKKWNAANIEYVKERNHRSHLMKAYGLTVEQRDNMLRQQGGACAVCRTVAPDEGRWVVDHDHKTDKVRGILCPSCNRGLGCFKDSTLALAGAIAYLKGA